MKLLNLQEIFNEKFFRIPDYQRGYSWGEEQHEDLWQDIEILGDEKDHYTGVLSVTHKDNSEDSIIPKGRLVRVIDGQQRITTLIILINAILNSDLVKEKEWINGTQKQDYEKKYLFTKMGRQGEITKSVFGYDKDNPSHFYFQTKILGLNVMASGIPSQTLYTQNLDAAYTFFAKKIKMLSFDEIEVMLRKVTEQLKFNYYEIDNELNEFVAFETMNNRGKKLSDLELLKNRLIYLSTLLPKNGDKEKKILRDDINEAWKIIYEYLGKGKWSMDDDKFLKNHWVMWVRYGGRSKGKVYKDYLLKENFTAANVIKGSLKLSSIREYAHDIQSAAKSYFFMHNPGHSDFPYSDEVKHWLLKLNRLPYGSFKPLITSILIRFNAADNSDVVEILKSIERFCFITFFIRFKQKSIKNGDIYRCTYAFHREELTLGEVKKSMSLDALNTVNEISNVCSQENFDRAVWDRYGGFYGWNGLHYFLYEYEIDLQKDARGEEKLKWEDINTETIEHIYPQTPVSGWGKFFRKNSDKELLHDLGNLLLLSQSKNSKIGNDLFANKKEKAFKKGSYSAIEVSICKEWTPKAVYERREKMLKFLWRRWGLQEPKE